MTLQKYALKYVLVGFFSNLVSYLIYLILTRDYLDPKTAMSALYISGAIISFFGNKLYTFQSRQNWLLSLIKFFIAHCVGYALNYTLLMIFVDIHGFPHEFVQGASILIVAVVLFVLFRYFVFPIKDGTYAMGK